jgi:catechol 2,3-dioxygenase-like lactoylglutathione lyase family enzyme
VKLAKLNHISYFTSDIPATIEFYTKVLGMSLAGVERREVRISDLLSYFGTLPPDLEAKHFGEMLTVQFAMQNGSRLAFMQIEGVEEWSPNPLPRWIKHLAMKVADKATLLAAREKLLENNLQVWGVIDHGPFQSIYFFDPINDIRLEYTCDTGELDEEDARLAWEAIEIWRRGEQPENRAFLKAEKTVPVG